MSLPRSTWKLYASGAIILWAVGLQVLILQQVCATCVSAMYVDITCHPNVWEPKAKCTLMQVGEYVVAPEKA